MLLDVSEATLRNWMKQSFIVPNIQEQGRVVFKYTDVDKLRRGLLDGSIAKLKSRANKKNIASAFIPTEYLKNTKDKNLLEKIIAISQQFNASNEQVLFVLSLRLLVERDLIRNLPFYKIIRFEKECWQDHSIKKELKDWYEQLSDRLPDSLYQAFSEIQLPSSSNDVLGLIYQSLQSEGDKSRKGSYYTPQEIVDEIVNTYITPERPNIKVLDPCCGSGQFLMGAINKTGANVRVHGYDNDPIAVRLARINISLAQKTNGGKHSILEKNFLLEDETPSGMDDGFDLILSNPPWGAHFNIGETIQLKDRFPQIFSSESFSYFIKKSLDLLKPGGVLSFILPESVLNVKTHKDIRKIILDHSFIEQIICLNRIFKKIFTPVIRLDIRKKEGVAKSVCINTGSASYTIQQERFLANANYEFDIYNSDEANKIITKVYETPHVTLKNRADWALGIVTGDNEQYISDKKKPGYEALVRGSDIMPYQIKKAGSYIKFVPEKLQQVAPEYKYRAKEKLIYRFISKGLVVAYDDQQRLCLNSANSIIPRLGDYPVKVILVLFNSTLYQYLFKKKFSTIKILRNQLEELPLPLWDPAFFKVLTNHADVLLSGTLSLQEQQQESDVLNSLIMQKFDLNGTEMATVLKQ